MTPWTENQWSFFLFVGRRIVPPLGDLDDAGLASFRTIISTALAERPASVQRQIRAFLALLQLLPLLRWGRTFQRLPADRQKRFLRWLQDEAPSRLRQGFWGLKTLVFMGYYGQAELWPTFAYTPSPTGNEHLRA